MAACSGELCLDQCRDDVQFQCQPAMGVWGRGRLVGTAAWAFSAGHWQFVVSAAKRDHPLAEPSLVVAGAGDVPTRREDRAAARVGARFRGAQHGQGHRDRRWAVVELFRLQIFCV